jgi:hypothetical protein
LTSASDVAGDIASDDATGLGGGARAIVSPPTLKGGEVGDRNDGENGTGEIGWFDDDDEIDDADTDGSAPKDAEEAVFAVAFADCEGPDDDVEALEAAIGREANAARLAVGVATTAEVGVAVPTELEGV